jgi:hypothetical protein
VVFNTTFNNILVLLVEETGVPWENYQPVASHKSHNFASSLHAHTQSGRIVNQMTEAAQRKKKNQEDNSYTKMSVKWLSSFYADCNYLCNQCISPRSWGCVLDAKLCYVTTEEIKLNPDGQVKNSGPLDYKIPGLRNIPRKLNVTLLKDSKGTKAV